MTLVLVFVLVRCAAGEGDADSTIAEEETTAHRSKEKATSDDHRIARSPMANEK